MVLYASKLRHIGVAGNSKGWLLEGPQSWKVSTAISVQFNKDKPHANLPETPLADAEDSIVSTIECVRLGDELDAQEALVEALEARDTYGNDFPMYSEAMRWEVAAEWADAMEEECKLLEDMEVWVEADLPGNKKQLLRTRWLLGTKCDMDGCRKARIMNGGHRQEKNINYDKTFAPTPTFLLLWTALTVAAKLG